MLTHIATLGASADALAEQLTADGLSAAPLANPGAPPPGTAAAIGDSAAGEDLVRAAKTLGARGEAVLKLLSTALAVREGGTSQGIAQKQQVAEKFANALGLPPADTQVFIRGALLHDLGKLMLPNSLLLTKSLLTHSEWEELRRYPELGATLCAETPGLEDLAELVAGHQECYDGTGYPGGIERDAIPYLARATRLVNVYCAMTSPRAYRTGHASAPEAMAFVKSELGKHFDPDLGAVFVELGLDTEG